MLKKLQEACSRRTLNFFWDKKMNMFEELTDIQMSNVSNRLEKIIKEIESQPIIILDYFCKYTLINV